MPGVAAPSENGRAMRDENKAKEQLISELEDLRRPKIGASDSTRTTLAKTVSDWREFERGRDSSAEKPAARSAKSPGAGPATA